MNSQNLEEKIILDYFQEIGTFLDVGSNDGETFSNSRALALKGWRGVCVEPDPKAFKKLRELYPKGGNVYCYPYAISDHNDMDYELYSSGQLIGSSDTGLVSTHNLSEKQRFEKTVSYEKITVRAMTWKVFLNRIKYKEFDFITIDAEGEDFKILRQIDLTNTKMVCVEWNSLEWRKQEFETLLNGFRLIYTSGENLIYAR